jgi:hypothetical protein
VRELTGEDAHHVLFAVGAGVAADRSPRGIATDGRLAVPVHGGAQSGVLVVDGDGHLSIVRASDAPTAAGEHGDLLELPLLVWDGAAQPASSAAGGSTLRAALGITPAGRVVLARGTFSGDAPLAEALTRVGCTRALALDRGADATAFLDRAGGPSPPRGRYDETVLFAVSASLKPRGFRFEASSPYVPKPQH